ncbi:hypothetical protein TNCT_163691, partial [Trichonephila clavata]
QHQFQFFVPKTEGLFLSQNSEEAVIETPSGVTQQPSSFPRQNSLASYVAHSVRKLYLISTGERLRRSLLPGLKFDDMTAFSCCWRSFRFCQGRSRLPKCDIFLVGSV